MSYSETIPLESKTIPGVTVILNRLGLSRRIDMDTQTLPYRQRRRALELEHPSFSKEEIELERQLEIARDKAAAVPAHESEAVIKAEVDPLEAEMAKLSTLEIKQKRQAINMEYALVEALIRCEMIRASVKEIHGGELEGMTANQLLDYGPQELSQEIYVLISADTTLRGKAAKNSKSPTTSGAVEKATPENTIAPSAEVPLAAGT